MRFVETKSHELDAT